MANNCSYCGSTSNEDNAAFCSCCKERFVSGSSSRQQTGMQPAITSASQSSGGTQPPPNSGHRSNNQVNQQQPQPSVNCNNMLAGRISRVSRSDESPEKTGSEYLAKFLIGILILVPYLVLFFASGIMAIALGIMRFPTLAGMLNPFAWTTALAELLELLVLSRLRGGQNVPVYRGTIRIEGGIQRSFIMVGPFRDGDFEVGDDVEFTGITRNGAFHVSSCRNVTTSSTVVSQYRNRWPLVLRVVMFVYLFFGGYLLWLLATG